MQHDPATPHQPADCRLRGDVDINATTPAPALTWYATPFARAVLKALVQLHALIRHNCPPPYPNPRSVYRELLPALSRQTHEQVALGDGFVFGFALECPRHQGRFDIRNGKALRAPACGDLRTHAVKIEAGAVYLGTD